MTDLRHRIQMARIRNESAVWATLVAELAALDLREGMKAACSGAVRAVPGSAIRHSAGAIIMDHAEKLAALDLRAAIDAAVTAAIYSAPDSEIRARSTAFIVAHVEQLAVSDAKAAAENSQFAAGWAQPGSALEREAAAIWSRLSVEGQSGRRGAASAAA